MPRVALAVNQIVRTGVAVTEVTGDATNNHEVPNNGDTMILAHNSGAGARTITFLIAKTVDGVTPTPVARSLAAGVSKVFGPFPVSLYGSTLLINVELAEMKLSAYRK